MQDELISQDAQAAITKVLGEEGGYTPFNPVTLDPETNWGITVDVARAEGYTGAMADMPQSMAIAIYYKNYYVAGGCDLVEQINSQLAADLFEIGVNIGTKTAGKLLQYALNALYYNNFSPLIEDGNIGNKTVGAIKCLQANRGAEGLHVVRGMFIAQVSVYYQLIAKTSPNKSVYEYGWQLNRAIGAP